MSLPNVEVGPNARRDLDERVLYLRDVADPATAERFADAAVRSFRRLAESSAIGSPVEIDAPALAGLRKWRVDGFPKIMIFYLERPAGVTIVRVLHAAQDWAAALES